MPSLTRLFHLTHIAQSKCDYLTLFVLMTEAHAITLELNRRYLNA